MSKTPWTPGPWQFSLLSGEVLAKGSIVIVDVDRSAVTSDDERDANGHVIAAACELYDALLEISDALEGARAANPEASIEFFEELVEIEPGWRERIKTALAKARGEAA